MFLGPSFSVFFIYFMHVWSFQASPLNHWNEADFKTKTKPALIEIIMTFVAYI